MVKTPSPVKVTGSSTPAMVPATPVGRPISSDVHAPMRSKRFKIKWVYVCVLCGATSLRKAPLVNQQRRVENDAINEFKQNFIENQELTSNNRYNIKIDPIKRFIFLGNLAVQLFPSVIFSAVSAIRSCSIKSSISPFIMAGKLCSV